VLDKIKLARKRKSTKSDKLTDDFFLKYSNWKTSDSNQPLDTSPAVEYTRPTQSVSFMPKQRESASYDREITNIPQSQPSSISDNHFVQKNSKYDSELQTQPDQVSDDYPTSAVEFLKENVVQDELGTFGIDDKSLQQTQESDIAEKPKLFDQLSEALETSDSTGEPSQLTGQEFLGESFQTEEKPTQDIIPTGESKINIDVLSNKIGSLLKEVETIKSTKAEESADVIADSESDTTIEPTISLTDDLIENSINEMEDREETLVEEPLESSQTSIVPETKENDIVERHAVDIKTESKSEDVLMNSLRAKINEVMNFTDQISDKFKDESGFQTSESSVIEPPTLEKETISPPKFDETTEPRFEKDQEMILKTRSSSKAPLNKEKLQTVLGLLKDEDKTQSEISSPSIIEPVEEIKDVRLKISRKYKFSAKDDSLDVKIKFENKLSKEYNQNYKINQTTPEGWKIDQSPIIFVKNKNVDEKNYKLFLKGPLIEWRLTTGKFDNN
jgi:hypothetical protein